MVFGFSGESTGYGIGWCACIPVANGGGTGRIGLRVGTSNSVRTPNGCLARRVSVGLPGVIRIAGLSGIAIGVDGLSGRSAGRADAMRNRTGARVSLDGNIQGLFGQVLGKSSDGPVPKVVAHLRMSVLPVSRSLRARETRKRTILGTLYLRVWRSGKRTDPWAADLRVRFANAALSGAALGNQNGPSRHLFGGSGGGTERLNASRPRAWNVRSAGPVGSTNLRAGRSGQSEFGFIH
jgi:hypothetical protein